jgi:hypothetical protein
VPQARVAGRKEVKVYFYHDPGEYIDLAPVMRSVNAAGPARPAIEALLKGPTAAERRKGFESLASAGDFRIGSLKISGGTARVNFISTRRWTGWPGDLAPVRFKTAVELTLKQFPTVRRVIVSLNGDEKFYDERGNHVNSESAYQELFGTWQIVSFRFGEGVSVGPGDAKKLVGLKLQLGDTRAQSGSEVCDSPTYTSTRMTENEFSYDFRTTLKSIGIRGNHVDVVNVDCGGSNWTVPGAILIKVQDRQMLTNWDGVFFVLKKQRKN